MKYVKIFCKQQLKTFLTLLLYEALSREGEPKRRVATNRSLTPLIFLPFMLRFNISNNAFELTNSQNIDKWL